LQKKSRRNFGEIVEKGEIVLKIKTELPKKKWPATSLGLRGNGEKKKKVGAKPKRS